MKSLFSIVLIFSLGVLCVARVNAEIPLQARVYISISDEQTTNDNITRSYRIHVDSIFALRGYMLEFQVNELEQKECSWENGTLIDYPLCLTQYDKERGIYRVSAVSREFTDSASDKIDFGTLTLMHSSELIDNVKIVKLETVDNAYNFKELISIDEHERASYGTSLKSDEDEKDFNNHFRTEITSIVPNPFNPSVTVKYSLRKLSEVNISIFDCTGRKIINLIGREQKAGDYVIEWDGKSTNGIDVVSGIYFLRFIAGNVVQNKKLVLLR